MTRQELIDYFKKAAHEIDFSFDSEDRKHLPEKFMVYMDLMLEHNNNVNLTAITEPKDIIIKHFIDSLVLVKWSDVSDRSYFNFSLRNKSIIDVGTGAGFPGLVLAIVLEGYGSSITLLDPLKKRVNFLDVVVRELGLGNVVTTAQRSEDAGHDVQYREKFDIAVSRGVAPLYKLSEYCLPFVKEGGLFFAYKGKKARDEIVEAGFAICELGGEVVGVTDVVTLPFSEDLRDIVAVRRADAMTGRKYPRKANQIKNAPLLNKV